MPSAMMPISGWFGSRGSASPWRDSQSAIRVAGGRVVRSLLGQLRVLVGLQGRLLESDQFLALGDQFFGRAAREIAGIDAVLVFHR